MEQIRKRVLYVEDDADTCEMMHILLSGAGYELVEAYSTADALRLTMSNQFDLYILDNWLTDGTGVELCKSIRGVDPTSPVIFYSGVGYEADKQNAQMAGAQGYVVKPDLENLITLVELLSNESRGREQTS
jgi:DNA-binding response OmpR family regulator